MAKVPDLKKWLIPQLRKISKYWPEKHEVINDAKVKVQIGVYKNGNPEYKTLMRCYICDKLYDRTEIHVEHINPVVDPYKGFVDWNTYIERLFCDSSNLGACCKFCHGLKTKSENIKRRKNKK